MRPATITPLKCGTNLIREFRQREADLPEATRSTIARYLEDRPASRSTETYISPAAIFRLTYETEGTHAVPPQVLVTEELADEASGRAGHQAEDRARIGG